MWSTASDVTGHAPIGGAQETALVFWRVNAVAGRAPDTPSLRRSEIILHPSLTRQLVDPHQPNDATGGVATYMIVT